MAVVQDAYAALLEESATVRRGSPKRRGKLFVCVAIMIAMEFVSYEVYDLVSKRRQQSKNMKATNTGLAPTKNKMD